MARTDEIARELAELRRELDIVRADSVGRDGQLAVAIRRSRLGLTRIEQDEAVRKLRPPTSLLNWTPRQGDPSDPDIESGLLARLRRGNAVADSLGNTDVFSGVSNMIENPLLIGVGSATLGTSFAPGTSIGRGWRGAYVNTVGSSAAPSVAVAYERTDYPHNPFNSTVVEISSALAASAEQSAYVYDVDLSILLDPIYPYMVVAMAVSGDVQATSADLTTLTAQLELYDTNAPAVEGSSQVLDLKTFGFDDGARRIYCSVARPAGGWSTMSLHVRLHIRAVSSAGANRSYAITFGDPQKQFAWSPDPSAFTPAVGTWYPEEVRTYFNGEQFARTLLDETGLHFSNGAGLPDVDIVRVAANIAGMGSGDTFEAKGLTSVVPAKAVASATPTLSTTIQDITGAVLTFTPRVAETVLVIGTFDFNITTPSTAVGIGYLKVDALTEEAEQALAKLDGGTGLRVTVTRTWIVTLTGGASHTLQLRANKTAALGAMTAGGGHTTISVIRFITG